MTSKAQETAAPVKGTEAKSSAGIIQLSVCDASGVQESIRVDSSISHNAFRTVLKDRFGDCVPMWRPFMASVVRKGKLVRDACFRADKVGDNNTLHGLGIVEGDLLWFSFEAEAQALPPEWIAHPKDLIPLVETDSAARERERTARLKKLEAQLASLKTENRLALKKEDFVRVKELKPLMEVAQKKIDDFLAAASSPRRKSPRAAAAAVSPK